MRKLQNVYLANMHEKIKDSRIENVLFHQMYKIEKERPYWEKKMYYGDKLDTREYTSIRKQKLILKKQ